MRSSAAMEGTAEVPSTRAGQSQLLMFDGMEDGARSTTERSARRSTLLPISMLEPYLPFGQNLRQNFLTPSRAVLTVVMVMSMIFGLSEFEEHNFTVAAGLDGVQSRDKCKRYCERSATEDKIRSMVGGKGICATAAGEPAWKFEVCFERSKTGKLQDCKEIPTCHELPCVGPKNAEGARCTFSATMPVWKPVTVTVFFSAAIILIIQGLPSEVLLLGCASFFALLGIISRDDVFKALSDKGLTQVALLFPISAAIQETGLLEKAVGMVLGTPRSLSAAVPRMMFQVAVLSATLSNTATVAMFIPIICTWGHRLQVHPGKLLMPLSFASQLGGSATLLGSSHCMIAKTVIAKGGKYNMGFFDMTPVGLLLCGAHMALISVLCQTSLLRSSEAKAEKKDSGDDEDASELYLYRLPVLVQELGGMCGLTVQDSGIGRVPGVHSVRRMDGRDESALLEAEDELLLQCSVAGIVNVRAQTGVRLKSQDYLDLLGARRRQRFLYEASVASNSELLTGDLLTNPHKLRRDLGAALVAGPKARASLEDPQLGPSSVMLLEADHRRVDDIATERWSECFSLIQRVPNSSPLRTALQMDKVRNTFTCAGFALIILLYSKKLVKFDVAAVVYLVVLLVIQQLELRQVFGAMKVDIIFTIAGALAMGEALKKTGIVTFLSGSLLQLAGTNYLTLLTMVYGLAVFVSMFINNSATIGILGPLILEVVETNPDFNVKGLTWTLVFAAGSCFTTPLGYQTNLMVMPEGQYTFGDFVRFGAAIQSCHCVLTVGLVYCFCGLGVDILPPSLPNM